MTTKRYSLVRNFYLIILCYFSAFLVTACGGGNDGENDTNNSSNAITGTGFSTGNWLIKAEADTTGPSELLNNLETHTVTTVRTSMTVTEKNDELEFSFCGHHSQQLTNSRLKSLVFAISPFQPLPEGGFPEPTILNESGNIVWKFDDNNLITFQKTSTDLSNQGSITLSLDNLVYFDGTEDVCLVARDTFIESTDGAVAFSLDQFNYAAFVTGSSEGQYERLQLDLLNNPPESGVLVMTDQLETNTAHMTYYNPSGDHIYCTPHLGTGSIGLINATDYSISGDFSCTAQLLGDQSIYTAAGTIDLSLPQF